MFPQLRSMLSTTGLCALIAVIALGCRSRLTGIEGNLALSYPADDRIEDFNKPLAVGARLDLRVEEAGQLQPATINTVKSTAEAVMAVTGFVGTDFTVEGKGPGSVQLQVEASFRGTKLTDTFNMTVAKPEKLTLSHTCTQDLRGQYFINQDIIIPFDMERANGQPVIGYGLYPMDFAPATAVTLDTTTKDQQFLHLRTGSQPQVVTLSSKIDSTRLEMSLVSPSSIDGAQMFAQEWQTVLAGQKHFVLIWPTVSGQPVCQPVGQIQVVGQTPEVCATSGVPAAREDANGVKTFGWVEINPQKVGTCTFNVTYPQGANGAGVTRSFSLTVR